MDFFDSFVKLADSFTSSVQELIDQKLSQETPKLLTTPRTPTTLPPNSLADVGSYNFPSETYDQTWTNDDSLDTIKTDFFSALLKGTRVQMVKVSEYAWKSGIPANQRPLLWKMLVGYYTPWPHSNPTLTKLKKQFYSQNYVSEHLKKPRKHQLGAVRSDLQLVSYYFKYFHSPQIQEMLERVLYILFCESLLDIYPVGLAQITIIPLHVILTEYQIDLSSPINLTFDEAQLSEIESDLFCMVFSLFNKSSKEFFENPMKFASYVEKIVKSVDPTLHEHLISNQVEFFTLVHEWLVKMLFPIFQKIPMMVQLWDRYMVASDQFWNFHACVCAALIVYFSIKVKTFDEARQVYEFFSELRLNSWESFNMVKFVTFVCGVAEGAGVWGTVHENWMVAMRMKKENTEGEVEVEGVCDD